MTREEIMELDLDGIEARKAEIREEIKTADSAGLDAIEAEKAIIEERVAQIRQEIERRKADMAAVLGGKGKTIEKPTEERKTMTNMEIRNTKDYIDAFAKYIKTGDDKEARALLTENASGVLPVPEFVENIIKTAWENDAILSRVTKTYIRGNLKVAFERSADPAYVHTEGTSALTEESLLLGIVTMIPANIKKWIRVSDEAVAMGGETFLRYIYDELTYQIIRKLSALVIGDIAGAGTSNSASAVGIPKVNLAPAINTIPTAFANLSDEARDNVVIMNKLTYTEFHAAYAAGNFAVDPFLGMPVLYTSALPAYSAASANDVYAIVGDLRGAHVNYPEGDDVIIKWDDLSESEADLVKVVGRQYAAHAVTAPGRFVNLTKPAAGT